MWPAKLRRRNQSLERAARRGFSVRYSIPFGSVITCSVRVPRPGATEGGSGAVFRVLFPVTEGEPARRAPVLPVPRAAGQCSILVVEDEQAVRAVISTVLQSHGYEVLLAASGQEALDLATTLPQPIDLLLSDVVMPGMNGRQLAEQFSRAWPDTRVLLMSGYTDDVLVRTGANAGLPFLNKPFSPSQLLRAISQVLSQGQIGSATSPGQ